jgi:Ca2+-binding RTX toxin-like protein
MVEVVAGFWNEATRVGRVLTYDGPVSSVPGSDFDVAVGAFTGLAGLGEIADEESFDAFALGLLVKTSEVNDAGIAVNHPFARRFVGVGGGGNDTILAQNSEEGQFYGRGGDDWMEAVNDGPGVSDSMNGGDGADLLWGGDGDNTLFGGAGDDTLRGGADADTLLGSAGLDTVTYSRATAGVVVNLLALGPQNTGGSTGVDTLSGFETLRGSAHADNLSGDDKANLVEGGSGDDTLWGADGSDTLDGGPGRDRLSGGMGDEDWVTYAGSTGGMIVDLAADSAAMAADPEGERDTLAEIERVLGSFYGDELRGDDGRNSLLGDEGNDLIVGDDEESVGGDADVLDGGRGDDTIRGGEGDDAISGGEGADLVVGAEGDDTLIGGAGRDTADYRSAAAGVTVRLNLYIDQETGGAGADNLFLIENLLGSAFRDRLTGDAEDNRLDGRGGQDALLGGSGADTLVGAAGKDVLNGGAGGDVMSGGVGKDRYVYASLAESQKVGVDLITDLTSEDRILLTEIDANSRKAGNQAFDLVDALTGKAGQAALVYDAESDQTRLLLDTNGDAKADGAILLAGYHSDFINFAL